MSSDNSAIADWHPTAVTFPREPSTGPMRISGLVASLILHSCLLLIAATSLKSCGGSAPIDAGTDYKAVGLVERRAENRPSDSESESESEVFEPSTTTAKIPSPPTATALTPPVELEMPDLDTIGSGAPQVTPARPNFNTDFRPSEVESSAGPPPSAPAGVSAGAAEFLGVSDSGKRFVYIIDHSGSMQEHNKLAVAKAELVASLQALDAEQLFQVVFYNQDARTLKLPVRAADGMFYATDINRTLAGQLINSIHPDGGTDHMPALQLALSYEPDVVFFLTDADEPRLSAKDLDTIRRWNKAGTRIHCVEFGTGPEIGVESYLVKLARRNGGDHRYHDTSQFRRR